MEQGHYVQIAMHTLRHEGGELRLPLYLRVSDEKAYYAKRDKVISGISQVVIERYHERLMARTEDESYGN